MDVLESLSEDESYTCFLSPEYDAEVYTNTVIASSSVTNTLKALQGGVDKLNSALENHVSEHYEDLINQATGMDVLEESLAVVKARIDQLQRSMTTIKKRLSEPYTQMRMRTEQLARLQHTCDVLRRVTRIQYLTKRLDKQLEGGVREITKTSQTCNELQFLYGEGDLKGIDEVDKDLEWVRKARVNMENQAEQLLTQGLSSLNQNQTSTALQVFNSIGRLEEVVRGRVEEKCRGVQPGLAKALSGSTEFTYNGSTPGGAHISNTAAWRASLWTALDKWSTSVSTQYNQLHVLQRTLARRRDATSQRSLLEECAVEPIHSFVSTVHIALQQELRGINSNAKQALNLEYPKALRLVVSLWDHFTSKLDVDGLEEVNIPNTNVREVLTTFQCTYLGRSLNRILDPINLAFPGKGVPTVGDTESIVRIMISEITAARGDQQLKALSTKNVVKGVRDVLNKCESLLHHGSGIQDISGPPSQYHIKNIQVLNVLCTLHGRLADIPTDTSGVKSEVWKLLADSFNALITPFRAHIEQIYSTIQDTDLSQERQDISGRSGYLGLVEDTVNHLMGNYLGLVSSKSTIQPLLRELQDSLLSLYLYHLSVVRPLGDGGKMQLATDIAEMERVFGGLLEVHEITEQFKLLRGFRAVLFLSVEDMCGVRNVSRELLLNHLFSRAGEALLSPYKVAGWSASQYVAWLHSHPTEIVDMIQGALQWYEDMIRESGAPSFDPVYPFFIKLLQS